MLGGEQRWGHGVAVELDGWGMGGIGGGIGWWSEKGAYAPAFLTGEVAGHDRGVLLGRGTPVPGSPASRMRAPRS